MDWNLFAPSQKDGHVFSPGAGGVAALGVAGRTVLARAVLCACLADRLGRGIRSVGHVSQRPAVSKTEFSVHSCMESHARLCAHLHAWRWRVSGSGASDKCRGAVATGPVLVLARWRRCLFCRSCVRGLEALVTVAANRSCRRLLHGIPRQCQQAQGHLEGGRASALLCPSARRLGVGRSCSARAALPLAWQSNVALRLHQSAPVSLTSAPARLPQSPCPRS